jgi:hypothetical protein
MTKPKTRRVGGHCCDDFDQVNGNAIIYIPRPAWDFLAGFRRALAWPGATAYGWHQVDDNGQHSPITNCPWCGATLESL